MLRELDKGLKPLVAPRCLRRRGQEWDTRLVVHALVGFVGKRFQ